jgi:cytochrome P450
VAGAGVTAVEHDSTPADFVDTTAPGYFDDPYPVLARVRARAPIHRHPTSECWTLMRYADVDQALRDPALSNMTKWAPDTPRTRMIAAAGGQAYAQTPSFFAFDLPDHTPPRRMITPPFLPASVEQLRVRAQEIVDAALADKRGGDTLLLVEEVAFNLPYQLTCHMLGIAPLDDVSELREWTWKGLNLLDPHLTAEQFFDYTAAAVALNTHLRDVVADKRRDLGDDLMSLVIRAGDAGDVMTQDQIVRSVQTLYHAGMDTTVNQTSLSILALMRNREQWELLCHHPELLDNAVEELLRYDPTAQFMPRTTPAPYTIGGVTIPAGCQVITWLASANRDPSKFGPTADELDITRADAKDHVSFARGIHSCLGHWLARMELQVVIGTLVRRFPDMRLATDHPEWRSAAFIRGVSELPLRLA